MKLNKKGFTLIEVLAVVVILSILIAIMVPSVNHLINTNKDNNYENLRDGIIQATKIYLSDNRYDITIAGTCNNETEEINITHIKDKELTESKIPIKWLIESKDLSTDSKGNITNPKNTNQILNLDTSYILIKYECSRKDYKYTLESNSLVWE